MMELLKKKKCMFLVNILLSEIQNAWEVLQDAKRERDEFDKSCSNATKNAKDSNDIISRLDEALAS